MIKTKLSKTYRSNKDFIKVKIERGSSKQKEFYFKNSFSVGRSKECSIQLNEAGVSRFHIDVILNEGNWWIVDKNSSNGTYVNGSKIQKIELKNAASIQLGNNGPILLFTFEDKKPEDSFHKKIRNSNENSVSLNNYISHYFDESDDRQVGQHTRFIREAFKIVHKKKTSKYKKIIIAVVVAAAAAFAFAVYQNSKVNKQKELAQNIFYNMKSLELEISSLRSTMSNSNDPKVNNALKTFDAKYQQLDQNYNKLVDELGVYDLSDEDKLIIQTARTFGECELGMPDDFIDEVKNYINKWKSSDRLVNALERAKEKGYAKLIVNYLKRDGLPYQFFYLALQESDFKEHIVGPHTRYGYAKGIWQFISPTAKRYGLNVGPLADQSVYDPQDDRYNLPKATNAAAKYIKDIYETDAQASGLLVMASYNWGEHNILSQIRKMPLNPEERNFWKLLGKYRDIIPIETYNYVFYIFSAAVIGENPRLFGFNFDNPLKDVLQNIN